MKAPSTFSHRGIGKTLVTRTQGTKVGSASQLHLQRESSVHKSNFEVLRQHGLHSSWSYDIVGCVLQIASDALKGRVFECSLADLQQVRLESCIDSLYALANEL